ncbi:MAG: ATP-binding protein [Sphingobacteriales bacterium]
MFSPPCPCGFYGHPERKCTCTMQAVRSYRSKLSGPLLDRIDLHIRVGPADLKQTEPAESSGIVKHRVIAARELQLQRAGVGNALMSTGMVRDFCHLGKTEQEVLNQAMAQHKLSARSYERILKVARTVADLAGCSKIELVHLAEAINLRRSEVGGPA